VVPLTALAAIGLAPWLAMLSRSAIGGAVFATSIPGVLFVASQFIGLWIYGYAREGDQFTVIVMTVTMVSLSALGLVLGWRTFAGLEAIEGRGAEVALPFSSAASAVSPRRRSHPIWLLVKKELRLQQMTWVLAAIFVAVYLAVVLIARDNRDNSVTILTILYTGIIAIVIGSLAGGEERQLGVHDTQLLLPMSSRRKWTVKVLTSLGLAVALAIVLPVILVTVLPPAALQPFGRRGLIQPSSIMLLASLVTLGLYVSVVAGSGLRGLIASIPVGMAVYYCFLRVILPFSLIVGRYARTETTDRLIYYEPVLPPNSEPYVIAVMFGLFLVVVLRLALTNYRWTNPSPLRLASHAGIALAALTVCFAFLAAIGIR